MYNSNTEDLISKYTNTYDNNHDTIIQLHSNLFPDINEFLKMNNVLESVKEIFGGITALYNGPSKQWQEIREFIKKYDVLNLILDYKNNTKFDSFNRVLDDYNKLKTLKIRQTSIYLDDLLKIYILIVENLGILIKINTLKGM